MNSNLIGHQLPDLQVHFPSLIFMQFGIELPESRWSRPATIDTNPSVVFPQSGRSNLLDGCYRQSQNPFYGVCDFFTDGDSTFIIPSHIFLQAHEQLCELTEALLMDRNPSADLFGSHWPSETLDEQTVEI